MEWKKEFLSDTLYIYQLETCCFGEDALRLAEFASVFGKKTICDLGSGCGIIPFLLSEDKRVNKIYAVEIQPDCCKMMEQSVRENRLEKTIEILNENWDSCSIKEGTVDLVTCNPPYFLEGSGKVSSNEQRAIARHAGKDSPADVCTVAERLLKNGGEFCVCYKPERLEDLLFALREHHLEPKLIHLLTKGKEQPWLVLCRAKKGAKPGLLIEIK